MKRISRGFSFLFVLTLLAGPLFADKLVVAAKAQPSSTLPGLPFMVYFDVHNTGVTENEFPMFFVVEVTPEKGDRFFLRNADTHTFHLAKYYLDELSVPGGGRRSFQLEFGGSIAVGAFVSDARTWEPGTYALRLIFASDLGKHSLQTDTIESAYPHRVTSNMVPIVVEEPKDDEAETWRVMRSKRPREFGRASAGGLLPRLETTNRYRPYIAMMATPVDEDSRAEFQKGLLAEIPDDHPVADRVRLSYTSLRLQRALREAERVGAANSAVSDAYQLLVDLATSSSNHSVRASATEALDRVKHRAVIEELNRFVPSEK